MLLGLGAVAGSLLAAALGTLWQVDGLLLGTVLLGALALLLLTRPRLEDATVEDQK
jgi:hypothetical protein